jgi:hypothetical protein
MVSQIHGANHERGPINMPSLPRDNRKRFELHGESFTVLNPNFIEIVAIKMSLDKRTFKSALRWVYKYTEGNIEHLNAIAPSEYENYKRLVEQRVIAINTLSRNDRKRMLVGYLKE